jgi:ribosomal protein L11 methyltransferase
MLERIPLTVYELGLQVRGEKELLLARAILFSGGFTEDQISEEDTKNGPLVKVFSEDAVRIKRLSQVINKSKIIGLKATHKALKPKDWLTRWKTNWTPSRLTKSLDVVPVWCKNKYRPVKGKDYILMDTLLSFGTGLHETTQFVSQFIEDCRGQFSSFMDIGTGTGILTMVALKMGADSVFAIDIGDLSVEAAKKNFKVNKLKAKVELADIKTFRHSKTYDFVAANLVTQDLIDNNKQILKFVKPGGYLAISGISLDNLPRLTKAFSVLPLTCLNVKKGKQWSGLLYQKTT